MSRWDIYFQGVAQAKRRPLIDETPLDRANKIKNLYGNHANYASVVNQASKMRARQARANQQHESSTSQ